jgi:hypothetical protein
MTALVALYDSTDRRESADSRESAEPADPMEPMERTDPTEAIEQADPMEPMERTDPFDPMERNESSDHNDHLADAPASLPISTGCRKVLAGARGDGRSEVGRGDKERSVHLLHLRDLVARLQPARIGEEPEKGIAERFGLGTDRGSGSAEGRSVCLEPEHSDAARPQPLHSGLELRRAFAQLGGTELAGGGRHPSHEVGDANAEPGQDVLIGW